MCVVQSLYIFSQRLYIADVRLIFQEVLTFFNWNNCQDRVIFIRFLWGEVNVCFTPACVSFRDCMPSRSGFTLLICAWFSDSHYRSLTERLSKTVYFLSASWGAKSMCVLRQPVCRSEPVCPLISAVQVEETMIPSMESYRPEEGAQITGFTPFSMTALESTDLYCLRLAYTFK